MKSLLFIIVSTFMYNALSLVPQFSTPSRERGLSVTSGGGSVVEEPISISSAVAVSVETCTSRNNDISLSFFSSLVDASSGAKISLQEFNPSNNEIKINVPGYISKCLKVSPKVSSVFTEGNKQFARLVFRNDLDMSSYTGNSMEEKIESCLKSEQLISADGSWSSDIQSYISEPTILTTTLSGQDIDASMQLGLVFGTPQATRYSKSSVNMTGNSQCYFDESLGEELSSLRDEKTANDNRIVNLCESLNLDDIQQELESQAKLAPYQRDLLSNVLRQAQEKYVEEKLEVLETLGREILEAENYDLVKSLGLEYLEELENLETEIINPSKEELMSLGESLSKAKSTDERRQINSEMNKLSELIGALSNTSRSRTLPQVLDKLLEFGQSDTANRAALISIKSNEYAKAKRYIDSRSSGTRSRSITRIFSSVDKVIQAEHKKFKDRSEESRIVYEERAGLSRLSPQVKQELDRLVRVRDQKFDLAVRNIQRELAKCQKNFLGIMTSPISCKNAMANQAEWYREALSEKERYNSQISQLASKYSFYSNLEKQARENLGGPISGDLDNYNHQSSNYLGTYGMYGNSESASNSGDVHRMENRNLTLSNFNVGNDPSYQAFFSSPSRVSPYSNFNSPSQVGYGFH